MTSPAKTIFYDETVSIRVLIGIVIVVLAEFSTKVCLGEVIGVDVTTICGLGLTEWILGFLRQ